MKNFAKASACLLIFILSGCATASFTQTGKSYPAYQKPVKVFFEIPQVQFERIGIVSAQGGQIHQRADMLKAMQEEAAEYGANAIILISEENRQQLIMSAGQFGAFGGTATTKNTSALAVRIATDSENMEDVEAQNYQRRRHDTFSAGASVNALPLALGGYGGGIWFGKKRFRAFGEFYSLDIPDGFLRDGPDFGRIEQAYRLTGQYFFLDNLSGPFFSSGAEYTTTSMGYEATSNRVSYGSFYYSFGFGYLLRFNRHFYLDSGVSLNARWGEEEICVDGGGCFVPDRATPAGFIGLGVNF